MTEKKSVLFAFIFLLFFCSENEEMARKKLNIILEDDLAAIIEDIDKENLLEKPFFKILVYQTYEEGIYQHRAEVDFYFLKGSKARIARKYRYHRSNRMWERYYNRYKFSLENEEDEEN